MDPTFVIGLAFLCGVAVGAALSFLAHKKARAFAREGVDSETMRTQYEEYQTRVGIHFEKTGEFIDDLDLRIARLKDHLYNSFDTLHHASSECETSFEERADYAAAQAVLKQAETDAMQEKDEA